MKKNMKKALKGFTLVELIIVMALMSALMVMVGLILKPISQVFADTTAYTEDRYVMDGIAQYLDENLKYADKILFVYDKDYLPLSEGGTAKLEAIAEKMDVNFKTMSSAEKAAYLKKIQGIAIINDCSHNVVSMSEIYDMDDFKDNSGIQQMGRIYKSAYVNGSRKEWLVGGEAFYGNGSYFINIENDDNDSNGHIDGSFGRDVDGDGTLDTVTKGIRYTIYSLDPMQYKKSSYSSNLSSVVTFRDKSREDIQSLSANSLIDNYAEKSINFVNNPFQDDGKIGVISPIDADLGASEAQGNRTIAAKNANVNGFNAETDGYNIYIYYTVPE
ncbi:MAG: prepilin-type N-terminal cleavage/methylation domain-containing protein [Oscillospiraceae bacterium]|nr:prepilin-type N-terminal cleavage/methylation domain-containing protein [Oscillospiraceae bacterium]